ncbi:hypothetical protein OG698_13130 [Streptomyces sp. NBC_01003]|uniref:hypothetical protein n=1 Tax=unclassified Streptomyces TaxID=2593676 RepID=UPI00379910E2|nr:hypothetical protein OG698_13130 [Streptomyces sp. NBC_01003]
MPEIGQPWETAAERLWRVTPQEPPIAARTNYATGDILDDRLTRAHSNLALQC